MKRTSIFIQGFGNSSCFLLVNILRLNYRKKVTIAGKYILKVEYIETLGGINVAGRRYGLSKSSRKQRKVW